MTGHPRERTQARPTVFGLVVTVLLVVAAIVRPPVADPSVTGLVLAGLFGALVLGIVWPLVTVRTIGLRVVAAPSDLVVGQLATLELELTGRASGLSIGATGAGAAVVDVVAPGRIRIPLTVSQRGVYRRVRIDVGSDAPFGILWATRARAVELPRQLLVGPGTQPLDAHPGELPGDLQDPLPSGAGSTGEAVRSVRPYVTGDPAHLVHWPSTARIGALVVRELEPPAARGLAIVVDLTARPASGGGPVVGAADRGLESGSDDVASVDAVSVDLAAARAAGAAESARAKGARVVLCTVEATGPVVAEAPDDLAVQRRLALAIEGAPPAPPEGWPVLSVAVGGPS